MNLKTVKTIVILIVAVFVGSAILLLSLKYEPEQKSTRRMIAEEEISIEWQWYRLTTNKILYAAMPAISGVSLLLFSFLFGLSFVRKQSVLHARIGQHSEIPVHYKDLRDFYPIAINLSLAEIEASVSSTHKKAFQISGEIMKSIAMCTRVFNPQSDLSGRPALSPGLPAGIPSFREIVDALEPGDPMVLGFNHETNAPITGGFKRIYSCGIFGLSGSGKTTGLYSIISQSLLLYPDIKYMVIDPHSQKKEGLTRGLPKTGHFEHLDPLNVRPGLTRFVQDMEERLKTGQDYSHAPRVLLIDELPVVMRGSQGQAVEAVLGRVAAEGRGVAVFALIAGQDTRLKAAGGNRDLLTSQIAYNLRKKQARYLFDDADIVDLHKVVRDSKEPGLCVFAATDAEPVVMKQPLCTPADVMYVTQLVSNGEPVVKYSTQNASQPQGAIEIRNEIETTQKREETAETTLLVDVDILRETVVSWIETGKETISGLANKIEMNKGQVYRFTKGEQPSEALHVAFSSYYQKRAETP